MLARKTMLDAKFRVIFNEQEKKILAIVEVPSHIIIASNNWQFSRKRAKTVDNVPIDSKKFPVNTVLKAGPYLVVYVMAQDMQSAEARAKDHFTVHLLRQG